MNLNELWNNFIELFSRCINSEVETCNTSQLTGIFWKYLWRIKDDIASIKKIAENLGKFLDDYLLINSYKSILANQVLSILNFYKMRLFERVFKYFNEIYQLNEEYVKYIIYINRMDSSTLWITRQGPNIFLDLELLLQECEEIWNTLKNPRLFNDYSEKKAKDKSAEYLNYFENIALFADGIESFIDRIFEGSRRGENFPTLLNVIDFKIVERSLIEQIEIVNDLYKNQFYDVIPLKIRLILEFIFKKLVKWKDPNTKVKTFFQSIKKVTQLFGIKRNEFPTKFDFDRVHNLREWGNLSAHDTFPAITKREIDEMEPIITRLIKKLTEINIDLF